MNKMTKKIKILFFDFDGTISDAQNLSVLSLIKILEQYNYNYEKSNLKKLLGAKMPEIFRKLKIPFWRINKVRKHFFQLMAEGVEKNHIQLCVSVKPLWELKKQGYKLIVVTNSESSFIKASAKKLKVDKLFESFYTAERFTTKDKILKKLFKKYKIHPKESVYIGDRFSDIEYARSAGCYAIAIHNKCSWSNKKQIIAEKPDFIIKDFYSLKKVLKNLNSSN